MTNFFRDLNSIYSIYQNLDIHAAYTRITENLANQYTFLPNKFSNNINLSISFIQSLTKTSFLFDELGIREKIIAYGFLSNVTGFTVKKVKNKEIYYAMFTKLLIQLFDGFETDYDKEVSLLLDFLVRYTSGLLDLPLNAKNEKIRSLDSHISSLGLNERIKKLGENYSRLGLMPLVEEQVAFSKYV